MQVTAGAHTITMQVKLAASYASTSAETLFFALGDQPTMQIEIGWPSGVKQIVKPVPAERQITIIEPL